MRKAFPKNAVARKQSPGLLYTFKMNSFGLSFRVSIFGESHGEGIGIVLDGVPQGISLSGADFDTDIARRSSGARGACARVTWP